MIVVNSSNLWIKLFLYTYNNSKPNHSLRINSLLIENLRIKHVKQKKSHQIWLNWRNDETFLYSFTCNNLTWKRHNWNDHQLSHSGWIEEIVHRCHKNYISVVLKVTKITSLVDTLVALACLPLLCRRNLCCFQLLETDTWGPPTNHRTNVALNLAQLCIQGVQKDIIFYKQLCTAEG